MRRLRKTCRQQTTMNVDERKEGGAHRTNVKWWNYSKRAIYHVTIVVSDRLPLLGHLEGIRHSGKIVGVNEKEDSNDPVVKTRMQLSKLGMEVSDCIRRIPEYGKSKGVELKVLAKTVMDTHVHFVLFVMSDMEDMQLGDIIAGLKTGCNKALLDELNNPFSPLYAKGLEHQMNTEPLTPRILQDHALFETLYDATVLTRFGQLKRMIDYVHDNPRRKWMKIHHLNSFVPIRNVEIAGDAYDAIGNMMLLGQYRKVVHVRGRFSYEECRNYKNQCVIASRRGDVLVSPFISHHEREVRDFCLKEGHSVIQLLDNGFLEDASCPGGLLEYCVNGQVLLLVPSEIPHDDRKRNVTRAECVMLNERAERIAEEDLERVG